MALCAVLVLLGFSLTAYADTDTIYHRELRPRFPEVIGQGGGLAVRGGLASLYGNPAAAPADGSGIHLVYGGGWSSVYPIALLDAFTAVSGSDQVLVPMLIELQDSFAEGGVGGGFAAGVARTGTGVNAALMVVSELQMQGDYPEGLSGSLVNQVSGHLGWTQDFLLYEQQMYAGAQVRPILRTHSPITSDQLFSADEDGVAVTEAAIDSLPTLSGTALAVDVGIVWEQEPFRAGLYGRNLFSSPLAYTVNSFEDVQRELVTNLSVPSRNIADSATIGRLLDPYRYRLPASIGIGGEYDPSWEAIETYLNPSVQAEYRVVFGNHPQGFLPNLHLGVEAELFTFLQLWAGLNQGHFTTGVGAQLWLVDLGIAYYTEELRTVRPDMQTASDSTRGLTIEIEVRL